MISGSAGVSVGGCRECRVILGCAGVGLFVWRPGCCAGKERCHPRRRRKESCRHQKCSIMLLTETWLTLLTLDTNMTLPRFQLIWVDGTRESGKKKDGGLAVVGVTLGTSLKEQLCSRGIKLLVISMGMIL